jgi:ADP-ribose pyrophosphatase YjhB (NUDIX family)
VISEPESKLPAPRQAVRAIIIDGRQRVLLFKAFGDQSLTRYFWITPGGGITEGESDESALRRELREECALHQFEIGPLVWVREATFPMPDTGRLLQQRERFYLVRVDAHEVDVAGWDEFERQFMAEPRWWTLWELETSSEDFAPRDLARHLGDLIRGKMPPEPIDVGI